MPGIKMDRIDNEKDIWKVELGEHVWEVDGKENVRKCIVDDFIYHLFEALDRLEEESFADLDGDYVYSEPITGRPWWGISSGNTEDVVKDVPWRRK